jgi:succinate dehydrogenase/fumarate reductase cytochrome b subunit
MKINQPLSPHLTIYKPQLTSTFSIFQRIYGAFLGAVVRKPVITIKALLLEGLKVSLTAGKTKHAIKATVRGHSLVALLACPKIL